LIAIVTQCFAPDVGGIENLMTGLADQIEASGIALAVFADHVRTRPLVPFKRPYPVHRFGLVRPVRRLLKQHAIARLNARAHLAGVFADSWKSVAALPDCAAPLAVLAHGMEFPIAPSPEKAARIRRALARAQTIIASSAYSARLAEKYLDGASGGLVVVNPPIAPPPLATDAALARIDALIAGRGPVLATLARLEPRKGVDATLRSLPALRAAHPRLIYIVAGGGGDGARLRALAVRLGLEDCVAFTGKIDDDAKAALLSRTDVFAMPVRREGDSVEGYGLSYVEAAWYGAPSLAGREGGAVDAVLDGQTGLVCDGADDDAVRDRLCTLLDDAALRKKLGAAAAARARAQTWPAVLPRYLQAIGL